MPTHDSSRVEVSGPELARKLNVLMDSYEAENGKAPRFSQISAHMARQRTPISRARWHYMRSGTRPSASLNVEFLNNIAGFFGVNGAYLEEDDAQLPSRIEAQLDLLASMRMNKVRTFAARQLEGVPAETLIRIRELIDLELNSQEQKGQ